MIIRVVECQSECNFLKNQSHCDFFRVPRALCFVWEFQRTAQHNRNSQSATEMIVPPIINDGFSSNKMSQVLLDTCLAR